MSVDKVGAGSIRKGTFHAGDHVIVRSPEEILATLDGDGRLDGLPFMPEMLGCCGKRFRIYRRVEKTCMEVDGSTPPHRRFANDDVVTLAEMRCDGHGHDGCGRGCRIYWKEAWLRPGAEVAANLPVTDIALKDLMSRLKVMANEHSYFCQSTELFRATVPYRGRKKIWMIRIAIREVQNGEIPVLELARLVTKWCGLRLHRMVYGDERLRGPNRKGTPSVCLDLKPGERVRIKTFPQIVATLDHKRRNKGMGVCHEMTRCCGKEAEVRTRVERIIEERTGKMREMQNTVTLKNLSGNPKMCDECLCYGEIGNCPRGDLMYWREIWLERLSERRV